MVLGIDDLQHQSALRLAQRLNERAVAFLDFPLRRRQLRRGVEAVVQILCIFRNMKLFEKLGEKALRIEVTLLRSSVEA